MNSLKVNVATGHCGICEGNLYQNEKFCLGCVSQYGVSNS